MHVDRPLRLPVGNFRVLLRVEPEGRGPFGVLEHLVPHLRLMGLPERAIVGTDEGLGANRLRLRHVGFLSGEPSRWLGGLDGRWLGLLFRCGKAVGQDYHPKA